MYFYNVTTSKFKITCAPRIPFPAAALPPQTGTLPQEGAAGGGLASTPVWTLPQEAVGGEGGCSPRPSPLPCITAPHPGGSSHARPTPTPPGQIQVSGITECVLDAERRLEMREPRASVQER